MEASAKSKKETSQTCQWSAGRPRPATALLDGRDARRSTVNCSDGNGQGAQKRLRTLDDLQGLRCLESLAEDRFPCGNFSNSIGMDHVAAVR